MKVVWKLLAVLFGLLTFGAILVAAESLQHLDGSGIRSSYSIGTGIVDGLLQLAVIALLALATRGCSRRAKRQRPEGQ